MEQWKKLVLSIPPRQRIFIGVAAVAVVALLLGFSRWRHDRSFKPLFTGVAAEDASTIVAKLKESGVEYRIGEGGGSILVPEDRLPELRLQMAGEGLPKTGRVGFELFDRTNLGTTDFAEHINYGRALEGELERSIRSISEVDQARVHITFPKDSVFLESRLPAKASVLVKLKPGAKLSRQNVIAIGHLVSSAVEGLAPEAVSVLDMRGHLLSSPKRTSDTAEASEEVLEHRQRLERDMLAKINATLEPLVGPERFKASVAVDVDLTSGDESSETYDPEKTVMLTTQKSEESQTASGVAGVPGTASNLPRPEARVPGAGSGGSRRTENVTYQPSKTVRHTRIPQGNVKRISAALLIGHSVRWEEKNGKQTRIVTPPAPETLKVIRDITAAAIGLNTERGDQLVVESLPFESIHDNEPMPADPKQQPSTFSFSLDPKNPQTILIGAGAAGALVILLVLAFFVFSARKKKRMKKITAENAAAAALAAGPTAQEIANSNADGMRKQLEDQADEKRRLLEEGQSKLKLRTVETAKGEVLAGYLRESVTKDPSNAASVIRNWLREEDR